MNVKAEDSTLLQNQQTVFLQPPLTFWFLTETRRANKDIENGAAT